MGQIILIACFALVACQPRAGERNIRGNEEAYTPTLYSDPVTGCEYLSTGATNAITPRISVDGKTHKGCKGVNNG